MSDFEQRLQRQLDELPRQMNLADSIEWIHERAVQLLLLGLK